MTQLILGPIIGGTTSTGANLWGRANGPGRLRAWLGRRANLSDAWLAGESLRLGPENGYAGVVSVTQLSPNTRYHYSLSLSVRPPNPGLAPYPDFITFPQAGKRTSFNFTFGSCFRSKGAQSGRIFQQISQCQNGEDLRFILLLGDQIYADDFLLNGIGKVATSLKDYRAVYAHTFRQPSLRRLLQNLPAFMILDDHEVDDDWTWLDNQRTQAQIPIWDRALRFLVGRPREERQIPRRRVQEALQAYWEHQGMHAPPFELSPSLNSKGRYTLASEDPGSLAYTFTFGGAAFFVMDTRTRRVKNRDKKSILGEGQWKALEKWLLEVKEAYPVKFLVSSSTLLYSMRLDLADDRWPGFPEERNRLLQFLVTNNIENLYLLSGDMHSAHAIRADLNGSGDGTLTLWEFCSSPFEQTPNQLTSRTYRPLLTGVLKGQQLFFCLRQNNFGVVRVDFSTPSHPQVRFEVYGESGESLGAVNARG